MAVRKQRGSGILVEGSIHAVRVHLCQGSHYAYHLDAIRHPPTVATNPVGTVEAFATFDTNLEYRDIAGSGIGFSLAGQNLGDARYFHPGVNEASAGITPGTSQGYFSSLLPQPGRTILLSMWFDE
jgi:hypothetical protein